MLRRSHDHHRGLRARCDATAFADRSDERHQDRHLMTGSQSCKSAHCARRLSTGRGEAHSDLQMPSQIVRQFAVSDPIRDPFISRFAVSQLAGSSSILNRTPHLRLSNPDSLRRSTHLSLRAVSFLRGFRTAATSECGMAREWPASETLHKLRHCSTQPALRICANFGSRAAKYGNSYFT